MMKALKKAFFPQQGDSYPRVIAKGVLFAMSLWPVIALIIAVIAPGR